VPKDPFWAYSTRKLGPAPAPDVTPFAIWGEGDKAWGGHQSIPTGLQEKAFGASWPAREPRAGFFRPVDRVVAVRGETRNSERTRVYRR
jgi:hypothetical protein